MNVKIFNENKTYPFLVVDDWYTSEEEKIVWKELDYFYSLDVFHSAQENCAETSDGEKLAKNNRLNYDVIFKDLRYSYINKMMYKFQNSNFHSIVEQAMPIGKTFKNTNWGNTMINYYENNDFYKSHYDYARFTMLIWFYKLPKKFVGGDLYLDESDITVDCKHNRMILFPGHYNHKVNEIVMNKEHLNNMNGRFSITHFFDIRYEDI